MQKEPESPAHEASGTSQTDLETKLAIDCLIQEINSLKRKIERQNETIAINKERIARLEAKLNK